MANRCVNFATACLYCISEAAVLAAGYATAIRAGVYVGDLSAKVRDLI